MRQQEKEKQMRCVCGFERITGSILCRMAEDERGKFLVEVYGPDDRLMAQSPEGLEMKKALDFVEAMVDRRRYSTHYHWEEGGKTLMAANARRVIEEAATTRARVSV
jgi:hypothetical protein